MKYKTVDITEFNLNKKYLFLDNDAIGNDIIRDGYWEKHITEVLTGLLSAGDNCLDIGANFGYHTITMANIVSDTGKVFAFEPMRLFFQQINANACINNLFNVTTYNCAVGETTDVCYIPEPNLMDNLVNHGDTSISKTSKIHQTETNVIYIDLLKLPKIKFIKLDVQGCELQVLKGAKNTIKKDKPALIVEIEPWQLAKFEVTPKQLIDYIKDELMYDIYQMVTKHPYDYLCVPKNSKINLNFNSFNLLHL